RPWPHGWATRSTPGTSARSGTRRTSWNWWLPPSVAGAVPEAMAPGSGSLPPPGVTPAAWAGRKHHRDVLGLDLAFVEEGAGEPVVFRHGNPTSSFLWRNVLPALSGQARCLAPDLPGMGDSAGIPGPDPGRYSFQVHQRYLDAMLDALVPEG